MSAVEKIQAAIVKLTEWRGLKVPPEVEQAVLKSAKDGEAESMLGLLRLSDDRTIDAQLAILTHGLARTEAKVLHGGKPEAVWLNERDTLALADAILGADS